MDRVMNLTYASSLTNLFELNSSFAGGVMRIAYSGDNRNKSYISKETFDKCAETMRNCPIVCRYDRDSDEIGGHDMEAVRDEDGTLRLVNLTQPVGCVPESAKYWWETLTEDDGSEHEYLCVDVLLWKRQEAFRKIRENGITAQSMEITVKDGERVDGVYQIRDFEFTAFALLGKDEPCFEQASLEVFSHQDFKRQLEEMMSEMKESANMVNTFTKVDDINDHITEGGETVLNEDMKNVADVAVEPEEQQFNADEQETVVEQPAEQIADASTEATEDVSGEGEAFRLASELFEELGRTIRDHEKIEKPWGVGPRYCYCDCDQDAGMVYAWDTNDWLLYGFAYTEHGDAVAIDWESKKRMKYAIVEFVDGDTQASPFMSTEEAFAKFSDESSAREAEMTEELNTLRQYKSENEAKKAEAARDSVFSQFSDLDGSEAFEALKQSAGDMTPEDLEEKCYALRGRMAVVKTFSVENKAPKLKVEKTNVNTDPYGGLFAEYGIESN